MAVETTLRLVFEAADGAKINTSYANAKNDATPIQVKNLMETMVTNSDIFAVEPATLVGAEFVSREITEIDIS